MTALGETQPDERDDVVARRRLRAIGNPRYPVLSALLTAGHERPDALTSSGLMEALDVGFDNRLQRVLDGIQCYIESRGARPRAAGGGA